MKTLIAVLVLIAAAPADEDAAGRFELTSRFAPVAEAPAGRFAVRSRLQGVPESEPGAATGRFGVSAARKGPASPCDELLFRDGYE